MKNTKEFFEANPDAELVLEVDGQLFLASHRGAAEDHARRFKKDVIEHRKLKIEVKFEEVTTSDEGIKEKKKSTSRKRTNAKTAAKKQPTKKPAVKKVTGKTAAKATDPKSAEEAEETKGAGSEE